jgi:hypothetical protein
LSYHIKYKISADGRQTEIKVEGIKGPSCRDVTKQLESKFGKRKESRQTSEFCEPVDGTLKTNLGG